ncbi:hypothetical protein [Actinophytocola glycyrrhizae]|uniref:Uncharacterized protein n=1 Tax=Actinophytocola glycyrrhizae TaxID=2044873 RepID=A0ABV9S325_9PSEU
MNQASPIRVSAGQGRDEVSVYTNAGVNANVALTLYMRSPDDLGVTLMFGTERLALEFFDVASLEQLRDLADEGAQLLRTAFAKNSSAAG